MKKRKQNKMDETKLLEECVSINFTPLQTIMLLKTVNEIGMIVDFLIANNCIQIEKSEVNGKLAPNHEQTGNILIQSSLTTLQQLANKIYENGQQEIGTTVPEQFEEVLSVYSELLQKISYQFIKSLINSKKREN